MQVDISFHEIRQLITALHDEFEHKINVAHGKLEQIYSTSTLEEVRDKIEVVRTELSDAVTIRARIVELSLILPDANPAPTAS